MQNEIEAGFLPEVSWEEMRKNVGVEGDPRFWTFRFLLRGHTESIIYEINSNDRNRLHNIIQTGNSCLNGATKFAVFDTLNHVVAINLSELIYCHFLNDLDFITTDEESDPQNVKVFFCAREKPMEFSVSSDEPDPRDDVVEGEMHIILGNLENELDINERIYFKDSGEDVFIRVGDLAMLTLPLWVVEPIDYEEDD